MPELSTTEEFNENSKNIDSMDSLGIVTLINDEDIKVAIEVQKVLPQVAKAVDIISNNFLKGGRLFYFGAGTSGRLGVLDASECPPTFNTNSNMVQGIIAGGDTALKNAIEGAEDSKELANEDFDKLNISKDDTICTISASGNANYVVEILKLAKKTNCKTIAISSNRNALMKGFTDVFICPQTGAEVISGSTRMKAGTSQKLILNMLTTASMIKIGKVYNNYMVDLKPTNIKLKDRAARIVSAVCNVDKEKALYVLNDNNYNVKEAILNIKFGIDSETASLLLEENNGILRKVFDKLENE